MSQTDRALTWSASLIAAGLAVEVAASLVIHPLAFVVFLTVACPLVVSGMGLFFWKILASR